MAKHKVLRATTLVSAEQLDDMAAAGWILIQVVEDSAGYVFYFRKESNLRLVKGE